VILCHSANLIQLSHVLRDAAWAAADGYATSVFVSHAFLVSKVPEALKVGAGPCVREEPGELVRLHIDGFERVPHQDELIVLLARDLEPFIMGVGEIVVHQTADGLKILFRDNG
jgi:hypothetical protein